PAPDAGAAGGGQGAGGVPAGRRAATHPEREDRQAPAFRTAHGRTVDMNLGWDSRFETVLRAVLPTLSEQPRLDGDVCLRDNGLDSLSTVELLLRLETEYSVSIPDSLLTSDTFATPGRLWQALSQVRGEVTA